MMTAPAVTDPLSTKPPLLTRPTPNYAAARAAIDEHCCLACDQTGRAKGGGACRTCDGANRVRFTGLDAWEMLATRELIPLAWAHEPQRLFRSGADRYHWCGACNGHAWLSGDAKCRCKGTGLHHGVVFVQHPPYPRDALALAADPAAVLAAEGLALEAATRFGVPHARVAWRALYTPDAFCGRLIDDGRYGLPFGVPRANLLRPDFASNVVIDAFQSAHDHAFLRCMTRTRDTSGQFLWARLCVVYGYDHTLKAVWSKTRPGRSNPWLAVCELWERGFAFECILPAEMTGTMPHPPPPTPTVVLATLWPLDVPDDLSRRST